MGRGVIGVTFLDVFFMGTVWVGPVVLSWGDLFKGCSSFLTKIAKRGIE